MESRMSTCRWRGKPPWVNSRRLLAARLPEIKEG